MDDFIVWEKVKIYRMLPIAELKIKAIAGDEVALEVLSGKLPTVDFIEFCERSIKGNEQICELD